MSRKRKGKRPLAGTWPDALEQLKAAKSCLDAARILLMKDDKLPKLAESFIEIISRDVGKKLAETIEFIEYDAID